MKNKARTGDALRSLILSYEISFWSTLYSLVMTVEFYLYDQVDIFSGI